MAKSPRPSDDPRRDESDTVNEAIRSAIIAHAIFLMRFGGGVARRLRDTIESILAEDERVVMDRIAKADRLGGRQARQYLDATDAAVLGATAGGIQLITRQIKRELRGLVVVEREWIKNALTREVGKMELRIATGDRAEIVRDVLSRAVEGIPIDRFGQRWGAAHAQSIADIARRGYLDGMTIPQIRQAIQRATAKRINEAEAFGRTAVNHVATQTRERVYEKNKDLIDSVQWISVLDLRTTPICVSLDGSVFDVGKGPRPPAHFNCRSVTVPVLKSAQDANVPERIPGERRASMDGLVPSDLTAEQWIRGRSAADQDLIFGKTRGDAFRRGVLSVSDMIRPDQTMYTLRELREMGFAL